MSTLAASTSTSGSPDLTPRSATTPNGDYVIDITPGGRLGAGGHGVVFRGRCVATGEPVAVKVTRLFPKMSLKEAALLQQLEHPNVIKVHSMQRNAAGTALFMVMQLCTGGELFDLVAEHGALPLSCALRYFKGIVTGLNYCHSKGVAHRDLKPENVIMPSKDLDDVVICDFGMAALCPLSTGFSEWSAVAKMFAGSTAENDARYTRCGSQSYMAPEVIHCT
jgi:serine/threonine protein kinase